MALCRQHPRAARKAAVWGYLFSGSAVTGKTAYDVGSGGSTGLFRRDGEGYLYYDSLQNAAGYDTETGRFQLYDGIMRPSYTAYVEPEGKTVSENRRIAFNGNFLPFNDMTGATETPADKTPKTYVLPEGAVDLWFGMTMEFDFFMPAGGQIDGKDMVFQFLGDDDVFVYIDDVLVLDIGGTHGANRGSVNFADGTVTHPRAGLSGDAGADGYGTSTLAAKFRAAGKNGVFSGETFADYTKHTLKFFYLERGGNVSYCYLRFNMPTLPDKSLTVAKELSGGGEALNGYLSRTMDYRFRVLRPDGSPVCAGGHDVSGAGGHGCHRQRPGGRQRLLHPAGRADGAVHRHDDAGRRTVRLCGGGDDAAAADRAVPAGAVHRGQRHRHRRHAIRLHGLHRLPHRYALRR